MELGYDVIVVGGSFLHNTDINLIEDGDRYKLAQYGKLKFIHILTKNYKGNGLWRFYNLFEFHLRLFFLAKKLPKPDIISLVAAVPFCNITYFLAKKLNAKFTIDIVDLWPESFLAFGLVSKNNPFLKLSYLAEKWLYERAEKIVFSMEGGSDYIREKGWDIFSGGEIDLNKVYYINNGVDIAEFDHNKEHFKIDDSDLEDDETFKVIYLGSIRLANDIKQLVDAAAILKGEKNIKFLIYGDGDDRSNLEDYCKRNKISNVIFKQKWVEITYVPYILSKSSLNVLNYKNSSIFRYGGSQSKSFQYMASGKPIISNIEMNYCPIAKYKIGVAKVFASPEEYAESILSIVRMDKDDYRELCVRSRKAAADYDYKKLTNKFNEMLLAKD